MGWGNGPYAPDDAAYKFHPGNPDVEIEDND
jgi:hypothetical protein